MIVRRFDLELYDTVKSRDVDIVRDYFFGEPDARSNGIKLKVKGIRQ